MTVEESIAEVDCTSIRVSPFQPRRTFLDEELEELAASIRAVGLIHPPVVRTVKSGSKVLYYELIAGERRWRAAQKAGLSKLKVLVRESNDEQAAKATLIENVQRVNLDPIETADALRRLIEVFRMTQEEIAEKVGKKRSTVANYLRLLTLPEKIKSSVSSGQISMGHAKAILSLENPDHRTRLSDMIVQKQLTVRDAERESRRMVRKKRELPKRDVHLEAIQEKIQEKLGTKTTLERGKLTIHYFGNDDLNRLLGLIGIEAQ